MHLTSFILRLRQCMKTLTKGPLLSWRVMIGMEESVYMGYLATT